jgi:hypothetical protein
MSAKTEARRLACYLDAIGIRPALSWLGYKHDCRALSIQYTALPSLIRQEARRRGRQIVREVGLVVATAELYRAIAPPTPRLREKRERAEGLANLLSRSTGRCSKCKSWGRRKRSWPSHEVAEAFRVLTRDMSLEVYECPSCPGSYHLGHAKNQTENNF